MTRVLDVFSCIGLHHEGLSAAGGFQTVAFVERDEWRRERLAERYEDIQIYDDITTFRGTPGSADIVVGGPPCQRTSVVSAVWGYRTGETLWPHMLRVADEVGADRMVIEQPPGNKAWEAAVKADLERSGRHARRLEFAAADLGAPHIRRRVFILADRDLPRLESSWQAVPREIDRIARGAVDGNPWQTPYTGTVCLADGVPSGLDRKRWIRAIGDSNPPVMMTVIGRAMNGEVVAR